LEWVLEQHGGHFRKTKLDVNIMGIVVLTESDWAAIDGKETE